MLSDNGNFHRKRYTILCATGSRPKDDIGTFVVPVFAGPDRFLGRTLAFATLAA
jgi:hypothetical protein